MMIVSMCLDLLHWTLSNISLFLLTLLPLKATLPSLYIDPTVCGRTIALSGGCTSGSHSLHKGLDVEVLDGPDHDSTLVGDGHDVLHVGGNLELGDVAAVAETNLHTGALVVAP